MNAKKTTANHDELPVQVNPSKTKKTKTKQQSNSSVSKSDRIKEKEIEEKKRRIKQEKKIEELRKDLYEMWIHWGVTKTVNKTRPPIPPKAFLLATKQLGILARIYHLGGLRKASKLLGVEFLGGTTYQHWKTCVSNSPALQELVSNQSNPFDPYISPVNLIDDEKKKQTKQQQQSQNTSDRLSKVPVGYYDNIENARKELYDFWANQGLAEMIDPMKPPIPPDASLTALRQSRLHCFIQRHGGSKKLSEKLGDVEILQGKRWKQLVETSPVLQELVHNESNSFNPILSPASAYTIDEDGLNIHRKRKIKRKGIRPNGMMDEFDYIRREFYEFWVHQGIADKDIIDPLRPPIPPLSLVTALERNDLEKLWQQNGGRKSLGKKLGNVDVIDGRSWKKAVNNNAVLQVLISNTSNPFSIEESPIAIYNKRYGDDDLVTLGRKTRKEKRKPYGYWNDVNNVKEEIVSFWKNLGVTEHLDPEKPPLPSSNFLVAMGRKDLATGMCKPCGDRASLVEELDVEDIRGQWRETVRSYKIMQEVVEKNPDKFHPDIAPGGRYDFDGNKVFRKKSPYRSNEIDEKKRDGFWSDFDRERIRREIYEFWVHQGMGDYIDPQDPPIPPKNMCEACDRMDLFSNLVRCVGTTLKKREKRLGLRTLPGRWYDAFNSSGIVYIWAQNETNAAKLPPHASSAFELASESGVGERHLKTAEKKRKETIMAAKE